MLLMGNPLLSATINTVNVCFISDIWICSY